MFNVQSICLPDLETTEIDGVRHYLTPSGVFPSVTTVLGRKLDKTALLNWQKRVGAEEAEKVRTQAAHRGTGVHEICEKYLTNDPHYKRGVMPVDIYSFLQIKSALDSNVGQVYTIEGALYSARLKTAGRTDLACEYRGKNSVVDFKTSKRVKKEEWIESYFLQTTCYSLMLEELTPLKFPQIVLLIAVDHDPLQEIVKDRGQYVDRVLEIFT